jgi:hypothetical protein
MPICQTHRPDLPVAVKVGVHVACCVIAGVEERSRKIDGSAQRSFAGGKVKKVRGARRKTRSWRCLERASERKTVGEGCPGAQGQLSKPHPALMSLLRACTARLSPDAWTQPAVHMARWRSADHEGQRDGIAGTSRQKTGGSSGPRSGNSRRAHARQMAVRSQRGL